jgi:uncharacterized protein with GYD domain
MPTYISLLDWTDQGIRGFQDTMKRYDDARSRFESMGVRLDQVWWTIGKHDLVAVADAESDEAFAAAFLALGSQGNIRTTSMRAFTREEMERVLRRVS